VTFVPQRWLGATGRKVPAIVLDGELDLEGVLVLDRLDDTELRRAHEQGVGVVVRASSPDQVLAALRRPEVACALVSTPDLLELDLRRLTYG
jgi:hypothetical protein